MLHRIATYFCCLTLCSCVDHNITNNDINMVMLKASAECDTSPENMEWLQNLIRKSETDFSLRGKIYAIALEGRMIFVHQRYIMSCLPCQLLNCDGELIDTRTVDLEKVRSGMTDENLIYSPPL